MKNNIRRGSTSDAFVIVPEWVLMLPISATSLRVYCVIRRHADARTGECFPTRRTVATKARCSVASVDKSIKQLVANGAISSVRRKNKAGDPTSNLYTILSSSLPTELCTVASETTLGSPVNDGTGGIKNDARTRTKLNEKQSSELYDISRRQDLSLGAYLFNIGASLQAVQDTALERQLVVDEFLRLSRKQSLKSRRAQ
jgi:DNA-binding transcriptional MocR family regulator